MKSLLAFWGEFLRNPRDVGSVIPSSQILGNAVAKEVLRSKPGYVIELGAGTGSITHSLVQIHHLLTELIVIEKSEKLANVLLQRYAKVNIKAGCASLLADLHIPDDQPLTIVSSLPFRSLPRRELETIRDLISNLGKREAGFRLIQYCYFGRLPFINKVSWLIWERKHTVFANIPPATIWVLNKKAAKKSLAVLLPDALIGVKTSRFLRRLSGLPRASGTILQRRGLHLQRPRQTHRRINLRRLFQPDRGR